VLERRAGEEDAERDQRDDAADRADEQQRSAPDPVEDEDRDDGEDDVGDPDRELTIISWLKEVTPPRIRFGASSEM
jgi:hypothetical protein